MVYLMKSEQPVSTQIQVLELPRWITAKRYAELSGYTYNAIQAKCYQGVWTPKVIWAKAPDRHLMIDWRAVDDWINSKFQSSAGNEGKFIVTLPEWIQAHKYSALSGYTYDAIRNKCYKGIWAEGLTWIAAPDNRLMINWRSVDDWILNG